MANKLSVVVQAHQPTLVLGRCLNALMEQSCGEELEVIVVDHRARRSVHQLTRWWNLSLARQGRRSRVLHLPVRTATSDPDRLGLRACTGTLVAFVDETSAPERDWARNAIAALEAAEGHHIDISPSYARGAVHRRAALMGAMAIDERAVISAHQTFSDGFSFGDDTLRSRAQNALFPARSATVTRIERSGRRRFAPIEDYVCLLALVAALVATLMQNFAVAALAAMVWVGLTWAASRSSRDRGLRSVLSRPFSNVARGTQIMRSTR